MAFCEVKEQSELADTFGRMGSLGVEGLAIIPGPVFGSAEEGRETKRIVNLRTAKELDITIPLSVLARTDEVI